MIGICRQTGRIDSGAGKSSLGEAYGHHDLDAPEHRDLAAQSPEIPTHRIALAAQEARPLTKYLSNEG
jgi:hypothetical protein